MALSAQPSSPARPASPQADSSETATHFGYAQVPLAEKQGLVDDVFHKVAARYDLMNDFMSAGLHRVWKDLFAAQVRPSKTRAFHHLDVAGGTGDIALRVAAAGGPRTKVTVLDINADMLAVGRERLQKSARHRDIARRIGFIEGNAEALPFPDNSMDAYTIAFGMRNVPRVPTALAEAYRVLKPGGRFLCLEFSQVDVPLLDRLYDLYSFNAIPALGRVVAGDGEPYRYLVESIRQFPVAETYAAMIAAAGFGRASFTRLTGGMVAIHSGWKI